MNGCFKTKLLTLERLHQQLRYAPEEGAFYWRASRGRARKGARAGTLRPDGYRSIRIDGVRHLEHRLVWFVETGEWPPEEIDHRNRQRAANRVENLREATRWQNRQNNSTYRSNTSGWPGVRRRGRRWEAYTSDRGRYRTLGRFDTPEQASAAYKAARDEIMVAEEK